ncbi:hypothetical protein [Streptomyces sp. DB-54]
MWHALSAAPRPKNALAWLQHSPTAARLGRLAATGEQLTHQQLDELPPSRCVHLVRHTLVHTGALPERNEDLERVPPWLDDLLTQHPQHARLLQPYLHWFLLRRARPRAIRPGYTHGSGRLLRRKIRIALEFLRWLEDSGLDLADVCQTDVDNWLVAGTTCRYELRSFLTWTHARGLSRDLHVPVRPRAEPELVLDEDERWRLLDRCLTDPDMPLDARAAGSLLLLFGLPLTRICRLTANHLMWHGKNTHLLIGRHHALLPPAIADLLQQLAGTPHTRAQLVQAHRGTAWLFPGLAPGQPTGAETLAAELRTFGIRPRPARNAALAAQAQDLPAQVLADLLGLHTNTAVRWANYAKTSWVEYLAARFEGSETAAGRRRRYLSASEAPTNHGQHGTELVDPQKTGESHEHAEQDGCADKQGSE